MTTEIIRVTTSGEGLYEIAGISIKRSNNLPFMLGSAVTSADGENNNYAGDFSASCGLIYMRDAAAVVEGLVLRSRPLD